MEIRRKVGNEAETQGEKLRISGGAIEKRESHQTGIGRMEPLETSMNAIRCRGNQLRSGKESSEDRKNSKMEVKNRPALKNCRERSEEIKRM